METSVIYDLLSSKLENYRNELKNEDSKLTKYDGEEKEKLEKSLNEEQLKFLKRYIHDLFLIEEYIDFQIGIRTLNYGIKIGIQLQKSIHDMYDFFDEPDIY